MNNHQKSITNGRSDYPLMNSQKIECGKDPRFNLLYKVYESDFYYVNRRDNLSTELSGYEISNNYEWGIECNKLFLRFLCQKLYSMELRM